jgi:uncharacterized NAD(P)/FAD-binding protein YdhS
MISTIPPATVVAIIGGGFTGAAVAYHLIRLSDDAVRPPIKVVVFEPRPEIGPGLAYSTNDPTHRINVPATRMTLVPDDQTHFMRWLAANGQAQDDCSATLADGRCFPARRMFGRYVTENLRPLIENGRISHHRAQVETIISQGEQWRLSTKDGDNVRADIVVIATSHPPPAPPVILTDSFAGQPKFIPDPWAPDALAPLAPDDNILIVGTGLTMADVVASLDAKGHRGRITAISRRGQRSRGHAATPVEPFGDFLNPPSRTTLDLLRRIRDTAGKGRPWQGLFDRLRTQGEGIWSALPLHEQRRLIRHLRPFWDTHRFRIAPQIRTLLDRKIEDDTLEIRAASIQKAMMQAGSFAVGLKPRSGQQVIEIFDAIIATTGPGHTTILTEQPFLAGLAMAGLAKTDPTGLGLAVDACSHLLGTGGPNPSIFVAGPLARGKFGELMGLPEVTSHAQRVASTIITSIAQGRPAVPSHIERDAAGAG